MRAAFDPTTATAVRNPAAAATASTISTARSAKRPSTTTAITTTRTKTNTITTTKTSFAASSLTRAANKNNNNQKQHPDTRSPIAVTRSSPASSSSTAAPCSSSPPSTLPPQASAAADNSRLDNQNKTNKHNNSAHRLGPLHALNTAAPRPSSNHDHEQRSARAPVSQPRRESGANTRDNTSTVKSHPNPDSRGKNSTTTTATRNPNPKATPRPNRKAAESRVSQAKNTPRRPIITAATRSGSSATGDCRDRNIAEPSTSSPSPSPAPSANTTATTTTRTTKTTKNATTTTRDRVRPASATARNNLSATPASSRPAPLVSVAARPPLAPRNQNARLVAGSAKPSSMSKNVRVTMPYDRSTNSNGRPQVPATAQRGINKAPLTPKIAAAVASNARPTAQGPTLAPTSNARTPLPKRPQRINTANSLASAPRSSPAPPDSDARSAVSNVTARSGVRQSRVESARSTPSGTPNPDRHDGWGRDGRPSPDPSRRPAAVAFSPVLADSPKFSRPDQPDDFESKFFHADDAPKDPRFFHANDIQKSGPQATAPKGPGLAKAPGITRTPAVPPSPGMGRSPAVPPSPGMGRSPAVPPSPGMPKTPTFFYANETPSKPNVSTVHTRKQSQSSTVSSTVGSKFVHANGVPESRPSPPPARSRPSSVVSSSSRAPSSRLGTVSEVQGPSGAHRPTSPIKLPQQAQFAHQRGTPVPHVTTARTSVTSSPQLGTPVALRRTSTGTSRSSHSRSGSLIMGEADHRSPHLASVPSSPLASPFQAPLSLASIIQAAEEFGEDAESVVSHASHVSHDSRSEIHSPARSSQSAYPINELIAGARRERKVQDLQITNASLEAINRTLERQMRKQSAELRRYKRLSRAGTLSAMTSNMRAADTAVAVASNVEGEDPDLSDVDEAGSGSELDDFDEEDEEEDSFSETDSTTESLSPSVVAERDAKHRKRDEKRLQLDLTKHQQLLVDSQRLNQSIKRCLDWTELLISDAKKALDYKVRVSDIEIQPRPRVLRPPVDEDDDPTQTNINFDPDTTYEDSSMMDDDDTARPGRVMPLEPKLAGWKPDPQDRKSSGGPSADGS